jgi:hypothetical protein
MNLSFLSLFSNSNNLSNIETFIITFESVKNAEMMIINLANRSLNHFLTNNLHINMNDDQTSDDLQTDLKTLTSFDLIQIDLNVFIFVHIYMKNIIMKNIDSFTYMIIDRYTFEMFYDIMIDSDVFRRSAVDYKQFLAYQKNNKNDLIDTIKAETVNVQFEIGSIFSLKSITFDTLIELIKFHVIKTDTLFLLSLADMNRLKVYFNNVENLLVDTIKVLSVIKRFDHDFLLWKNFYFLHLYITQFFEFNFCYLIDVELRQLHRRFDHSSTLKLPDLLERFDHEVKKVALKKLIKFCTFCQKHAVGISTVMIQIKSVYWWCSLLLNEYEILIAI